jgi:DNA-binding response OmpR family regulator
MPAPLILIVEVDPATVEMLTDFLESQTLRVASIGNPAEALSTIQRERPDVLLLDLRLDHASSSGWKVYADLTHDPAMAMVPVVVMTTTDASHIQDFARLLPSPVAIVHKPFDLDHLLATVKTALDK